MEPTTENKTLAAAEIEELIVAFVRRELAGDEEIDDLDRDENLLVSGLVDSVGIVRLIGYLKRELGVRVPPGEMVPSNFRSVRIMAEYMAARGRA